jgi:hypothetical protein
MEKRIRIDVPVNQSNLTIDINIDGLLFHMTFVWNERASGWFLTLSDSAGDLIFDSIRVVVNFPLFVLGRDSRWPGGNLITLDTTGQGIEPGLRDLGSRVVLYYVKE